jgi:hypothetical protein
VKLLFDVIDGESVGARPPGQPFGSSICAGFKAPNAPARCTKTLPQFLGMCAGYRNGERVTVKDVVLYVAHVLGGAHHHRTSGRAGRTLVMSPACYPTKVDFLATPRGY